jgi:hypothetical protein
MMASFSHGCLLVSVSGGEGCLLYLLMLIGSVKYKLAWVIAQMKKMSGEVCERCGFLFDVKKKAA